MPEIYNYNFLVVSVAADPSTSDCLTALLFLYLMRSLRCFHSLGITDFKKNAELFNFFFAKQYCLIGNFSEPPLNLHYTSGKRLNCLNFSNSYIEGIIRQLAYITFISNNRASFHLWWKEKLVKYQKVSKYYENDCRSN